MRLQSLFDTRVGLGTSHGDGVACDDHDVDVLQILQVEHLHLLHDDVVTDIQLLQLLKDLLGVQELTMEL